MRLKKHPTHDRHVISVITVLIVLLIANYVVGLFGLDYGVSELLQVILLLLSAATLYFGAKFCRCPDCKSFLRRELFSTGQKDSQKFICEKCKTMYSTELEFKIGGLDM